MITAFVEHYLTDEGREYFPEWVVHVKKLLESNKDAISFSQVIGINVQDKAPEESRAIIEVKFQCLKSLTDWVATEEHAKILNLLFTYTTKHRETNIYSDSVVKETKYTQSGAYLHFSSQEEFGDSLISQNAVMRSLCKPAPIGLGRLTLASNSSAPLDVHGVKEALMVSEGEGKVVVNGIEEIAINTGDIVVFDSNESHLLTNCSDKTMHLFSVWWD